MKELSKFILENKFEDADEYLEYIVDCSAESPDIYDDTESWEAFDYFDYWEDARGESYDTIEFIKQYAEGKRLAGWQTNKSFEETEKIIPKKLKDIMKSLKPNIPYHKRNYKFEVWETKDSGFNINILKFKNYTNSGGTDYVEYWYIITVE